MTTAVYATPTYAAYAALRDRIETIAVAAAAMQTAAEQLDHDAADGLTDAQRLAYVQGLLDVFGASVLGTGSSCGPV